MSVSIRFPEGEIIGGSTELIIPRILSATEEDDLEIGNPALFLVYLRAMNASTLAVAEAKERILTRGRLTNSALAALTHQIAKIEFPPKAEIDALLSSRNERVEPVSQHREAYQRHIAEENWDTYLFARDAAGRLPYSEIEFITGLNPSQQMAYATQKTYLWLTYNIAIGAPWVIVQSAIDNYKQSESEKALDTLREKLTPEAVEHPQHYNTGKIEVWDFIVDQDLNFLTGNVVKYVCRAGRKDATKVLEDLRKAEAYLKREIKRVEDGNQ